MDEQLEAPTPRPFSLVRGGPLHRLLRKLHVIRPDHGGDELRVAITLVALTWVPLAVLGLSAKIATGRMPPIMQDPAIHLRLLVAIPLFCLADHSLHMRTGRCISQLVQGGWARGNEAAMARALAATERLRDARLPELILLVLVVAGSQVVLWNLPALVDLVRGRELGAGWTPAKMWYALVSLPVFQFMIGRWMWRWIIWAQLLWRISRLDLRPVATHPDRAGGLEFLSEPSVGFGYVVLANASVQAGAFADRIVFARAELAELSSQLAVSLLIAMVLALGPLVPFSRPLWRCRFEAVRVYSQLATDYVRRFQQRWIEEHQREDLLGSADIQSLADLGNSYESMTRTRLVLFGPRALVMLAVANLAPVAPLLLLKMPLIEIVKKLGGLAIGGAVPG